MAKAKTTSKTVNTKTAKPKAKTTKSAPKAPENVVNSKTATPKNKIFASLSEAESFMRTNGYAVNTIETTPNHFVYEKKVNNKTVQIVVTSHAEGFIAKFQ